MSNYSHVKAMIAKFSSSQVFKSPKENLDEISHTIILIGESGVGKSTFINAFVNYLAYNDYERAKQSLIYRLIGTSFAYFDSNDEYKTIKAFDDSNEIAGDWESATQKPKQYNLNLGNHLCIRLVDTPGLCDTRDIATVDIYVENLMKIIMAYKEITAICVVLKSDQNPRYNNTFHSIKCLIHLFTRLHYSIEPNIVFIFTHGMTTKFSALNSLRFINKFFDAMKMKLKITKHNSFVFDNDIYNYLLALGCNVDLEELDAEMSWQISSVMSRKLINHLISLKPHNVQQTVSVNKYCNLIEKLTDETIKITQFIEQNLFKNDLEKPRDMIETNHLKENHEITLTDSSGNRIDSQNANNASEILNLSKTHGNDAVFVPKSKFGKLYCNNCHKKVDINCNIIYFERKCVDRVENKRQNTSTSDINILNGQRKPCSTITSMPEHNVYIGERNLIIKALTLFYYHRKANSLCKYNDYFKKKLVENLKYFKHHNCKQKFCINEILVLYKNEKQMVKSDTKNGVTLEELENTKNILIKMIYNGENIKKIYRSLDKSLKNLEISGNDYIDIPFFQSNSCIDQTKLMASNVVNIESKASVVTATALFDYQAADCDEISFDPEEIITNIETVDDGWWMGMCRGVYGLFPANYVRLNN